MVRSNEEKAGVSDLPPARLLVPLSWRECLEAAENRKEIGVQHGNKRLVPSRALHKQCIYSFRAIATHFVLVGMHSTHLPLGTGVASARLKKSTTQGSYFVASPGCRLNRWDEASVPDTD